MPSSKARNFDALHASTSSRLVGSFVSALRSWRPLVFRSGGFHDAGLAKDELERSRAAAHDVGDPLLASWEHVLSRVGAQQGYGRKASSEEDRRALIAHGQPGLAKRWVDMRGGRRAAAHPDPELAQLVLDALTGGFDDCGGPRIR